MDAKKIFLILAIGSLAVSYAWAGETVVKGTASCVMPDLSALEMPAAVQETTTQETSTAPEPPAASGGYELIQMQENIGTVTVYTVCAK